MKKIIIVTLLILTMIMSPVVADLSVSIEEEEVKEEMDISILNIFLLSIVGDVEGGDGRPTYEVLPGSSRNILVTIQNDGPGYSPTWYKAYAYQGDPSNMLWESGYEWIESGEWYWDESWSFVYTAPTTPGTYTVYLESERGDPATGVYGFDDIVEIDFYIPSTATPTSTATPPGSLPPDSTSTATATVTPPGIVNNPPTAKITYVLMGGGKVILKGVESSDTDGTIEKYDWFINDVFVNGQSTFTQVFDTEGTYEIVLIVEDNDGATAQATLIVPVNIEDDKVSIIADSIDASAAEVTDTEGRTGIWFEDGALKVPGFEGLLAVMVLLILSCRKRGQD